MPEPKDSIYIRIAEHIWHIILLKELTNLNIIRSWIYINGFSIISLARIKQVFAWFQMKVLIRLQNKYLSIPKVDGEIGAYAINVKIKYDVKRSTFVIVFRLELNCCSSFYSFYCT